MGLAGLERLLGCDALRDVAGDLRETSNPTGRVAQGRHCDVGHVPRTVLAQTHRLFLEAARLAHDREFPSGLPAARSSGAWKMEKWRPRTSRSRQPVMCCAPGFQLVMRPSGSSTTRAMSVTASIRSSALVPVTVPAVGSCGRVGHPSLQSAAGKAPYMPSCPAMPKAQPEKGGRRWSNRLPPAVASRPTH